MNDKDKASIWAAIFTLGLFQILNVMKLSSFDTRNPAGAILPFTLAISLVVYGASVTFYYVIIKLILGQFYKRFARKSAISPPSGQAR